MEVEVEPAREEEALCRLQTLFLHVRCEASVSVAVLRGAGADLGKHYRTWWMSEMNRILSLSGVVLVVGWGLPPDGPFETYYSNGQLNEKGMYNSELGKVSERVNQ